MHFGRAECLERAERMEQWALGLMEVVPTQASASRILEATVPAWGPTPLIDIAMQLEMKSFLQHKVCQSLVDVWWRGGHPGSQLTIGEKERWLWLFVFLPPI